MTKKNMSVVEPAWLWKGANEKQGICSLVQFTIILAAGTV
ncbi:hypothetical protein Cflav_PD3542 [Pedosphaera parvula Ellin514]|uniref:Uncharacterized protein n=1 Tax=Pedosphaera parvula (strain Ellin514) TaxID=320771 RepID=B9XI79_PEDPL|nr:hypothetical protein Cflav_PD3542 [Pedosphaera parvula Ellin514]